MLKFRYLLIWAVVGFFSMAVLSFVIENYILKLEAMQVRSYTELAADCALQTGQGIDDFFAEPVSSDKIALINNDGKRTTGIIAGSWYNTGAIKGLRIKYDNGYDTFEEDDLLSWYMGKTHSGSTQSDRVRAFKYLYDASSGSETSREFYNFATSKVCLRVYTQLPYVIESGTNAGQLEWVKVPKIALIGAKCIWVDEADFKSNLLSVSELSSIYGTLDNDKIHKMWRAIYTNNYYNITKTSGFLASGDSYLLSPSKVGVSYIPRELVEKIYQNNLDLLLRARKNGDLQDYSGFVKDTWAYDNDSIYQHQEDKESYNDIVNNGILAISKNTSTITNIEYRCIDVFDGRNNALIESIYGGVYVYAGHFSTVDGVYKVTANTLRMLHPATLMTESGGVWTPTAANSKYEVVAKVTFSTDVILSHKTAVFTNWGTTYDKSSDNINDIEIKNGIETNKATRNKKYIYTRFYDINA